jgi:hypothetical protein
MAVYKTELTAIGDPLRWQHDTHLSTKVGTNLADKWPLRRYSSLVDLDYGAFLLTWWMFGFWYQCTASAFESHRDIPSQLNSVALVRDRIILTERPPLVGEVSASGQSNVFPRPFCRYSRSEKQLFLQNSSSIVLTRLNGPSSSPTTSQKIC